MDLPDLTMGQYSLVYNMLSFAIACMFASFVFFLVGRSHVGEKYRMSLLISALVVGIAGYHYLRIFGSFEGAYTLSGGMFVPSGEPFNDGYRYVDWLLTVPLLMVELIAVLALSRELSAKLLTRLTIAAVLMIGLGYPGEISDNNGVRALWGTLSTIPFIYILYVLWVQLGQAMKTQPPRVQVLVRNIRLLTLATWGFYPIAYMGPMFGLSGAGAEVFIQVGYSIADVAAKCGYGVMIYHIARAKTIADQEAEMASLPASERGSPTPATV